MLRPSVSPITLALDASGDCADVLVLRNDKDEEIKAAYDPAARRHRPKAGGTTRPRRRQEEPRPIDSDGEEREDRPVVQCPSKGRNRRPQKEDRRGPAQIFRGLKEEQAGYPGGGYMAFRPDSTQPAPNEDGTEQGDEG